MSDKHLLCLAYAYRIYFAYAYPIILYGIELYANTYSTHLEKLCILNNTLLHILQFKHFPVLKLY